MLKGERSRCVGECGWHEAERAAGAEIDAPVLKAYCAFEISQQMIQRDARLGAVLRELRCDGAIVFQFSMFIQAVRGTEGHALQRTLSQRLFAAQGQACLLHVDARSTSRRACCLWNAIVLHQRTSG